jgi:hypothetical protein
VIHISMKTASRILVRPGQPYLDDAPMRKSRDVCNLASMRVLYQHLQSDSVPLVGLIRCFYRLCVVVLRPVLYLALIRLPLLEI